MFTFQFKTPLTALQVKQPATSKSSTLSTTAPAIKDRVKFKQEAMADRHDRKFHAAQTQFKAGEWVRVKLPTRAHKSAPVFSEPFKIAKAAGNTVWLTNGKRWNVRRCIRHRSAMTSSTPQPVAVSPAAATPPITTEDEEADSATFGFSFDRPAVTVAAGQNGPRRSGRIRRPIDFGPYNLY